MHTTGGSADTATDRAERLRALVYTSPTHEFEGARGTFSPTTSTLIAGQRKAVLIDAQYMASDVTALGDMIESTGKELSAIYITHGHADHHFGLGPLLERFPRARPLATPGVIEYITANSENETGLWSIMFGDRFVRPTVIPEPLEGTRSSSRTRSCGSLRSARGHPAEHSRTRPRDRRCDSRRRRLQPDPRDDGHVDAR